MTKITTTPALVATLSDITSKKLEYNNLVTELQEELAQSELVSRITKWQAMIAELNKQETDIKNQWIEILKSAWIDKFEANWVEVRVKTTAWSLVIDEEDLIPEEYKTEKVKTTISVDKKLIKENMKQWEIIDWVHIEQKVSLEVKYK